MADDVSLKAMAAALACLLGLSAPTAAADFERGQALYDNHCRSCHEVWAHTREHRTVTSLAGLRARVAAWSVHAGLDWGKDEIDDVTDYLNRRFYRFGD